MTPTIEEYTALLHLKGVKLDQVYTKAHKPDPLVEKLMKLAGMGKAWAGKQIHKRGNNEGITWNSLRSLLRSHPDPDKSLDILAVGIYGLVIFPKSLRYIEAGVIDLFGQYGSVQFIPVTARLDLADFSYKVEFWEQVKKIQKAWTQPRRVETEKARPMFTIDYEAWRTRHGFDNIPLPDQKNVLSFEEHLKVVPTEVEVVRHECEVEKNELKRRIRELETQSRDLDLDVVYYKKQLRNVEKERDQLAEDFTDLQASH
ncbi:hypothetical protein GQ457_10G009260 [Hibiscus cannabinus]